MYDLQLIKRAEINLDLKQRTTVTERIITKLLSVLQLCVNISLVPLHTNPNKTGNLRPT